MHGRNAQCYNHCVQYNPQGHGEATNLVILCRCVLVHSHRDNLNCLGTLFCRHVHCLWSNTIASRPNVSHKTVHTPTVHCEDASSTNLDKGLLQNLAQPFGHRGSHSCLCLLHTSTNLCNFTLSPNRMNHRHNELPAAHRQRAVPCSKWQRMRCVETDPFNLLSTQQQASRRSFFKPAQTSLFFFVELRHALMMLILLAGSPRMQPLVMWCWQVSVHLSHGVPGERTTTNPAHSGSYCHTTVFIV